MMVVIRLLREGEASKADVDQVSLVIEGEVCAVAEPRE
jgi:hypothetical protein